MPPRQRRDPASRQLKQHIRTFWDGRPCGTQFVGDDWGSPSFFEEVERHRYTLEPHIPRAVDFLSTTGLSVLEIGCGLGTDAVQFARAGARYTGIDLSPRAVSLTQRRFALLGLSGNVRVGDAEHLDFAAASFDVVYSHGVLHHTPDTPQAIRQIFRVLRPGGQAIVMLYHRDSLNYRVKIRLLRRLRAPLLRSERGIALSHWIWREPLDEVRRHAAQLRADAAGYLHPDVFLSRNTDGAHCPLARVYSAAEARALFHAFVDVRQQVYSPVPAWWPDSRPVLRLHAWLARRWGWHLWTYARRPSLAARH